MSKNARSGKPNTTEPRTSSGNVDDVFDLPIVDDDIILTGAAADATLEEKLKNLPRILRVALLIDRKNADIPDRLVSDIETLRPGLLQTAAFATVHHPATALVLAKELDRLAVADDVPELRHIADCVRLCSLPIQKDLTTSEDYWRVTRTLLNALAQLPNDIDSQLGADIETFCVGWATIPALRHRLPRYQRPGQVAATEASALGALTAARRIEAAEEAIWTTVEARAVRQARKVKPPINPQENRSPDRQNWESISAWSLGFLRRR